jgi:hypothetical protein
MGRSAVKWGGMRKRCRTKVVSLGGLGVTIVHAQPLALTLGQTQRSGMQPGFNKEMTGNSMPRYEMHCRKFCTGKD